MTNLMRCVCCGKEKLGETLLLVVRESVVCDKHGWRPGGKVEKCRPATAVFCDECMEEKNPDAYERLQKHSPMKRFAWTVPAAAAVCLYAAGMVWHASVVVYAAFAVAALAWIFWKAYQNVYGTPRSAAVAKEKRKENLRAKLCAHFLYIRTPDVFLLRYYGIRPDYRRLLPFSSELAKQKLEVRKNLRAQAKKYYTKDGARTSQQPSPVEDVRNALRSYKAPPYPSDPRIAVL